jgi:DNA repair protein RadC
VTTRAPGRSWSSNSVEITSTEPAPPPAGWAEPDSPSNQETRGGKTAHSDAKRKLFARGAAGLTHAELIALVLGGTARSEPVDRIARRLVRRHGLAALARLGPRDWQSERGLGRVTVARMCAVFELGRRVYRKDTEDRPKISSPREAWKQLRHLGRVRKEHLVGLYLDAQNVLIRNETISIGSLNTTRTHPREILHPAVTHLALGFVLAHNHPSGCPDPSAEDVEFTQSIRRAGELMGIELYDHLIVTRAGYTSLRERGLL